MTQETITVTVGGQTFNSWVELSVHASFKKAARSFAFKVAASVGASATNQLFALGTPVQIYATGTLLVSGFVNQRKPKYNARDAYIMIAGRAKGQDHIDSTAMHATGQFANQDPVAIVNALGQFGVQVSTNRVLQKLDYYQLTPGDTVHHVLDDLCRDQGMTPCGQPDGSILITDASQANRHGGGFYEGQNIEEAEGDFDDSNRHSETHVRGQSPVGHGDSALRMAAKASDSGVTRNRVEVHHHHGRATAAQLKKRAADRRNRKAGNSCKATIVTPSWRDAGGAIWTPGNKIWVQSAFLGLAQDMLLEDVDFECKSKETGVRAHCALVDPQAYGGQAGKASSSGSAWNFDTSPAT